MGQVAVLELDGVCKSYGLFDKKRALGPVSLRVERGDCFGLAGANGAGKTTLIRILLGLSQPDEGEAFLFGQRPDDPEVRRRVGFVPEAALLPDAASPRALVRRWARLRGLPAAATLAQGLETLARLGMAQLLDRPAGKLSKGERQRTLLSLAMLGSPELLVLDEPTDGLDPLGRARMREVIQAACDAGGTVFLNSHLLAETERICSRVGLLHRGRLVRVEALDRAHQATGRVQSSIALAAPLSPEQLARAGVQPAPESRPLLRERFAAQSVRVQHADPRELNAAIDRLRAEGALLVELRRVTADLETTLAEVVGDDTPTPPGKLDPIESPPAIVLPSQLDVSIAVTRSADSISPGANSMSPRPRPLRALRATARVAQEIAAELASRKLGWVALGGAALAASAFVAVVRSDAVGGAAAFANEFGSGGPLGPAQVAATIGGVAAKLLYWTALAGSLLLAAVFVPSLLEPRRTVLLHAQPISRGDHALGIWGATCALAFACCALFFSLAFCSLRWLGLPVPWTLLFAPLPWLLAFAALHALQLLIAFPLRSALLSALAGLGLMLSTSLLGSRDLIESSHSKHHVWGILYALLPRTVSLMEQAARLGKGERVLLLPFLPTLGLLVAYLLLVRVLAGRSER